MRRTLLVATIVMLACRHRGEGTNIQEFATCVVGPNRSSVCAAGLFCDTSKAYEEREGHVYVRYGSCMKQKSLGDACLTDLRGVCRAPLVCVNESDSRDNTGGDQTFGHCRQPETPAP